MAFFIMSVWALGQAFCDVKALLNGKKVRLMHTRETFDLSLEGLFRPRRRQGSLKARETEIRGLSYVDYLRLFSSCDRDRRGLQMHGHDAALSGKEQ